MTTFDNVATTWLSQINKREAGQRRIKAHALALYYGADQELKPMFFLITSVEPNFPRLADVVSINRGRREDGRWTVVLTLQNHDLTEAFIGMCIELARRSAVAMSEASARAIFFETLTAWKALLAGNPSRIQSIEKIRGVVAELWFGLRVLGSRMPLADAVLAWHGPYGSPQDFVESSGVMHEVKSIHSGARTLEISSVDQLDPLSAEPLSLVVVTLDEVTPQTSGCITLPSIARQYVDGLSGQPKSIEEFEHRIAALAIDLSDVRLSETSFHVGPVRAFQVSSDFPRIHRADVALAIDRLNYRLRIAGIERFEIDLEASN